MENANGHAHFVRRRLAVAALACVPLIFACESAMAERVSRSEFNAFMDIATGATKHTIGTSSNGVPIATRGVPGPTQVGNMNFAHSAGGWPTANANVDVPSPITGKPLAATAKQGFTKASTAAALGRFAAKVVTPLAVGVAIYDLMRELGDSEDEWTLEQDGSGTNKIFRKMNGTACVSNCKEYSYNSGTGGPWFQSLSASFSAWVGTGPFGPGCGGASATSFNNATGEVKYSITCSGTTYNNQTSWHTVRSIPPYDTREKIQRAEEDLAAAIASESGWPSTSAVDRALADAMNSGLADLQKMLDTENAAAITAAQTKVVGDPKTTTLSDGTTNTETETCEWVQGIPPGPLEWRCWKNVTTVTPQKTTTETVVKSNPDGTTSTETITKTTPSTTTTGTTTAATSELNDKLCPDGSRRLVCSELDVPTAEVVPSRSETVTFSQENLGFGGGSCPSPYGWTDSMGAHAVDMAPFCSVLTSVVRPLVLAIAALMAVFIVLPRET